LPVPGSQTWLAAQCCIAQASPAQAPPTQT